MTGNIVCNGTHDRKDGLPKRSLYRPIWPLIPMTRTENITVADLLSASARPALLVSEHHRNGKCSQVNNVENPATVGW